MKPLVWVCGFLAACSGAPRPPTTGERGITANSQLADLDVVVPSYGHVELQKALIAARGIEASREHAVTELETKDDADGLRVAIADLAVQRRFIAMLEVCEATGRWCPPRLDDPPWSYDIADDNAKPPLDTPLRFDVDDWRKIGTELFGRACACRTMACVESLGVAIDRLETRAMADVRNDDAAAAAVTHARECLFRLRGKSIARTPQPL